MPLPIATRDVHISIVDPPTGASAAGTVQFRLPHPLHDTTDDVTLAPGIYTATLDGNGETTIALPVNDESGVTPTGWSYAVLVRTTGGWVVEGYVTVPAGDGSTLEFSDLFPSATVTVVNTYATVGALSAHDADTTSIHGITDTAALIANTIVDAKGDLIVGTADNTVARLAVGTAGYVPLADPSAATGIAWYPYLWDQFTAGTTTVDRREVNAAPTMTSQLLRLAYFTAPRAETIANLAVCTSSTAAGATPSLVRFGIYSVAGNGDLTLVASIANDTALFAAANTRYARALSVSLPVTLGQRYALGVLVVTAAAAPTVLGVAPNSALNTPFATSPKLVASLAAQSDLPSSISSASLAQSTGVVFGEVYP